MFFKPKKNKENGCGEDYKLILDYLIGTAQKTHAILKELEEIRTSIDMMQAPRPEKDITESISDIMSFSGRSKHDA